MRIHRILAFVCGLLLLATAAQPLVLAATSQLDFNENNSASDLRSPNGTVIYVKANVSGTNGLSWADAYPDLQVALGAATSGDEIWVAAGTYKPGTERTDRFVLKNGVAIYGGFNGTETARDQRDWEANATILSGDLNGDDNDNVAIDEPTRAENSYYVVRSINADNSAILDGFTITGGNANNPAEGGCDNSCGGGLYNYFSSPALNQIIFTANSAQHGGAMYNLSSSPQLTDVTFTGNVASQKGGAMRNSSNSSPTISDATFENNSAPMGGGIINSSNSSPTINNTTFISNSASYGGGMHNEINSSPTINDTTFTRNSATQRGGGMSNLSGSSPSLSEVTFTSNDASFGGGMNNESSSNPQLEQVMFMGNRAQHGGGIYNINSSPTVNHATFTANWAYYGGGMDNYSNSSPIISYSTFNNNHAEDHGGGMYSFQSNPTLHNVTFAGNSANGEGNHSWDDGGGMFNSHSTAILSNVRFSGNYATSNGGGMRNDQSNVTLNNVTFSGNYSKSGGAIADENSTLTISNSILWNNKDHGGTDATSQLSSLNGSTATVTYSIVQGGWPGEGNIGFDPLFVSPINPDDAPTLTGDMHLSPTSPAIDAGDNSAVPADTLDLDGDTDTTEALPFDLDGTTRFQDHAKVDTGNGSAPLVDMGAYETGAVIYVKADAPSPNDGSSWTDAYTDLQDALAAATADNEIWVAAGTYKPTDDGNRETYFRLKNGVRLYGGFDGTETAHNERDWEANQTILSGDLAGNDNDNIVHDEPTRAENSYHVVRGISIDNTAKLDGFTITGGNGNGSDAWTDDSGGMRNDLSSPTLSNLIFVNNTALYAGGMFNYDSSSPTLINVTFNNNVVRDYAGGMLNVLNTNPTLFHVAFINNVATNTSAGGMSNGRSSPVLYHVTFTGNSGAKGGGGMKNFLAYPIIMDATFTNNIADDGAGMHNYDSYPTINNATFRENVAATGGGGGIYNVRSDAIITNGTFTSNTARLGGGVFNYQSNSTVRNTTFIDNSASDDGGGMYNSYSNSQLYDVTFTDNQANDDGGGMFNTDSSPSLVNIIFRGNSAHDGGGMLNSNSNATVINSTFNNNSAGYGGGMYNYRSNPTVSNVTFSGNVATRYGAGMRNVESNPTVSHVTFTGNLASDGGGAIANLNNSGPKLINSILWNNKDQNGTDATSQIFNPENSTVTYSIVQGGWEGEGTGNLNVDPLFLNPVDPDNAPTTGGNLHLKSTSPAINAGNNSLLPADTLDLDGDSDTSEAIPYDLDGNERIVNGTVDLGAYEMPAEVPNVLAIYALAFDNPLTSTYSLAPQFPEAMQSIVDATIEMPDKTAIVLVDLPGEGNTHIRKVHNGVEELIAGLPDADGNLSFAIDEYDMADGEALGGFLKWALSSYSNANSKTIFSYVGHGAALVPESDYQVLPDSRQMQRQDPVIPLPYMRIVHPNYSDDQTHSVLSPYDLAQALEMATNDGQNPIDVLDLVQCFSGTIEQFYELSNPGGQPYAKTISGSPNFTYMSPKMLGVALEASQPTDEADTLATTLISTYNTVLAEDDEETNQHPRLLVAMDSSKIADIKTAWNNMSKFIEDKLAEDRVGTKEIIVEAYKASAKYDTTFCEADWALESPDALVDMVDFANRLSDKFGFFSEAGMWAGVTELAVEDAIIAKQYMSGKPWLSSYLDSQPEWDFEPHAGIALYADFMGVEFGEETLLSWQAHWYTDEVSTYNRSPYAFVQDTQWDQVLQSFWDGENVGTRACLPPLLLAQRDGEVSAKEILFPLPGTVTTDTAVLPVAIIEVTAADTPLNPQVKFEVSQEQGPVFSNTVSAGVVTTGTHQVEASKEWLPDTDGPFTLTVTVDADNRISEANEADNIVTQISRVSVQPSSPRPIIEATVNDGQQTITSNQVPLGLTQDAETSSAPVETIAIQVYQYDNDENPNIYVPTKKVEEIFSRMSLPQATLEFRLPNDLKPGPVVLHVWGRSRGGLNAKPQVIKFNYMPPATSIAAGEADYFTFQAKQGQNWHLMLDLLDAGDANLFAWDPLNYGPPIWRATDIGDDQINIESVPLDGEYIIGVYGQTDATYTLSHSLSARIARAAQRGAEANPEAYVPATRPIFIAPIPELPEIPEIEPEIEIVVDNTDSDHVSLTGSWVSSTVIDGYIGADYIHDDNQDKGAKSVRFTAPITTTCEYQVELNWTADANRASNVPVEIKHAHGTERVMVNQQENGGQWNALGTYTFAGDGTEYIEIQTADTDGHVIADGLRLESVDCVEEPTSMTITPLTPTVVVSDVMTVEINISDVIDLYGAQVELEFDASKLEVVDANGQPSMQIEHGELLVPDTTIRNKVDQQNGTIEYAISLQGKEPGVNGSGTLARVHFRALEAGMTPVIFTNALLATSDALSIEVEVSHAEVMVMPDVEETHVSGNVLLADESDQAGTEVCVDANIEDNCVTTGADGSYLLQHLPLTGTLQFSHEGYISQTLPYEGTIGQTMTLTDVTLIKVKAELTVSGKVTLEYRDSHEGTLACNMDDVCVTTSADGTYRLENMPLTGSITLKHSSYLSQTITYAGEASEVINLPDVQLVLGDLSGNGEIDIDDATIIGQAWNSKLGDANWNVHARADLNGDGVVNILDMVIIQRNWGKKSISARRGANLRQPVSSDTVVLISPANSRLFGQGEVVEMKIKAESVTNLYGANLVVTFDPTLLQVRDLNANENGIQIRSGDFLDETNQLIVVNRVDNQAGIIEFAVTQTYPADARNGDGVLASITFDSIGEGHSAISLTEARLVDNSTPDPQVIPVTMQNGSVLIGQQKLYLPTMMRP